MVWLGPIVTLTATLISSTPFSIRESPGQNPKFYIFGCIISSPTQSVTNLNHTHTHTHTHTQNTTQRGGSLQTLTNIDNPTTTDWFSHLLLGAVLSDPSFFLKNTTMQAQTVHSQVSTISLSLSQSSHFSSTMELSLVTKNTSRWVFTLPAYLVSKKKPLFCLQFLWPLCHSVLCHGLYMGFSVATQDNIDIWVIPVLQVLQYWNYKNNVSLIRKRHFKYLWVIY